MLIRCLAKQPTNGAALQGGSGPALAGAPFQSHWTNRSLRDLLHVIATQMPLLFEDGSVPPASAPAAALPLDLPASATLYAVAPRGKPDDAELLRAGDSDCLMYNRSSR
jgi:hypothetical protein